MSAVEIAEELMAARRRSAVLDHFPGGVPADLAAAEAIQEQMLALWSTEPPRGWKIGAIAPRYAPPPTANRVFGPALTVVDGAGDVLPEIAVPPTCLVEAELAVRFRRLPAGDPAGWDAEDLLAAEHDVLPAIEVCGSAVADLNDLGPWAVTADCGNNVAAVIGAPTGLTLRDLDDRAATLLADGATIGEGGSWTVPGGIADGIAQLVRALTSRGRTLAPGDVILTGSLAGAPAGRPGQEIRADFGPLGSVGCRLVAP